MKDRQRMIYLIGGAAVLLALVIILAISCSSADRAAKNTATPLSDAAALYQSAVDAVSSTENLTLTISQTKETIIGSEAFMEQSEQTVAYEGLGTERPRGMMQESLTIGTHTVSIQELFADGVGYFTVADANFQGTLTFEEYLARYAPVAPLNADMYESISGVATGDTSIITFAKASGIEAWCAESGTQFVSADGTAYISESGQLTKSIYHVSYTLNEIYFRLSTTVEISYAQVSPITPPEDTSIYKPITYLDAPRMLEKACGHLLKAVSVTASYSDSISCQAFGDQRTQTISISSVNAADWSARIDTTVELINSSKVGTVDKFTQSERFLDNVYSVTVDGGEPAKNSEIDADSMRQYCQDLLVGTIMLPQYILNAELSETEDAYHIKFTASEEFAQLIRAEACTTLYQDAQILSRQTESYTTDVISCYLTVHKPTGLPAASGFCYQGTYTIGELPYQLHFQADQQYDLLNDTAHSNIKEEAGA